MGSLPTEASGESWVPAVVRANNGEMPMPLGTSRLPWFGRTPDMGKMSMPRGPGV